MYDVAALRALVDPSWLQRIYLPYTGLLDRGQVIRNWAVKADACRVVLASGAELSPDYLVPATGSGYPLPTESDVANTEAAHDQVRDTHAALAAAGGCCRSARVRWASSSPGRSRQSGRASR